MQKRLFSELAAFLFILLFVYAALSKLVDYDKFSVQLGQSPLVTRLAFLLVWLVPAVEIIIALLLSFSKTRLAGFYFSFVLMVMFTAYIIAILYYSPYVPCSCGGVLEHFTWQQHLVFNAGFVILCGLAIVFYPKIESVTDYR